MSTFNYISILIYIYIFRCMLASCVLYNRAGCREYGCVSCVNSNNHSSFHLSVYLCAYIQLYHHTLHVCNEIQQSKYHVLN
jgi:hypothetical protein